MSYIVPMEKPKRCGLCPCFHAEHPMHCQAIKASKDKRIIAPYGAPIPDWCPLVELPEKHGDLVDRNKLLRKAKRESTYAWKMNLHARTETILNQFIDWLDEAEVIIEAEGGT